ncbi:RICIN domain-containing protein [Agaribacterium sp. ZY112]|uniref:RICIN domain-containing protein n=1 Tax=Agaribacterium sp. ZY112 TaxID=3233574 RepID=UPI003525E45B
MKTFHRTIAAIAISCAPASLMAADWDAYPVPANAGAGKVWQLQPQSDEFNYNFNATSNAATFGGKWTNFYHNAWEGPGPTRWRRENTSVAGGNLQLKATRVPGETKSFEVDLDLDGVVETHTTPATRAGCITSTTRVQYPVFVEARVKIANAVMASDIWLLSPDDTQEIDILEAYGGKQARNDWFAQRLHLSHHVFIRSPFQDYQPKDASTWYTGPTKRYWTDSWIRIGVNWVSPTRLEYYVDGQLVKVMDNLQTVNGKDGIDPLNYTNGTGLNKAMDIIINMEDQNWNAAAGRQPTNAEITNTANHTMKVDWLRVYKPVNATTPPPSTTVPPAGATSLRIQNSNRCVDLAAGSSANGAAIQQWSCNSNNSNQDFNFVAKGGNWFEMKTKHNKCVGIAGGSTANGAAALQWDCFGGNLFQFTPVNKGNNWYQLKNRQSNKCLQVKSSSNANGAKLEQWTCSNSANQYFKFE